MTLTHTLGIAYLGFTILTLAPNNSFEGEKQGQPNLSDTLHISRKTIAILRPDSARFQSYVQAGDNRIYEADSDFGFGTHEALESFEMEGVKELYTTRRYISIRDCATCPRIVDRDTIDYGIILTRPHEEIMIDDKIFGKEYYLEMFESYFGE